MSVTTGTDSKSPKTPSPTKSSPGLSEVTKHTYSRLLLKTSLLLFFRQAFIFWHFSPSPHFIACHWSHPQLLFPKEKKILLLMRRTSSIDLSSNCITGRCDATHYNCTVIKSMALSSSSQHVWLPRKDFICKKEGSMVSLPKVQEVPEGQCCPVCMCKNGEGTDTWPHLSGEEFRRNRD